MGISHVFTTRGADMVICKDSWKKSVPAPLDVYIHTCTCVHVCVRVCGCTAWTQYVPCKTVVVI